MSYDLYFMKEHRGKTPMDYFEDLQSGKVTEADPASTIDVHDVSGSLLGLGIGLRVYAHRDESEGEIESIELTIPQPTHAQMWIRVDPRSVTLTIPYWDQTSGSIAELRQRWDTILPRMTRLGLVGYDPQHSELISGETFNTLVTTLADAGPIIAPTVERKPWWKVW